MSLKSALRLAARQIELDPEAFQMVAAYVRALEDGRYGEVEVVGRQLVNRAGHERLAAARRVLDGDRQAANDARARCDLLEAVTWMGDSPDRAIMRAARAAARAIAWRVSTDVVAAADGEGREEAAQAPDVYQVAERVAFRAARKDAWQSAYDAALDQASDIFASEMMRVAGVRSTEGDIIVP